MKVPSIHLLRAMRSANLCTPLSSHVLPCRTNLPACSRGGRGRILLVARRSISTTAPKLVGPPKSKDRGPISKEDTQTDFGTMDVLANMAPPSTAIDACLSRGFHFNNGMKIGDGSGCLLISGEAFSWRPWENRGPSPNSMINEKGQWEVDDVAWGAFELVWPKPELLILGLGAATYPISSATRKRINSLGIRVDIQDTRNAAAQFNLLATERGVGNVAAALIPIGWRRHTRI